MRPARCDRDCRRETGHTDDSNTSWWIATQLVLKVVAPAHDTAAIENRAGVAVPGVDVYGILRSRDQNRHVPVAPANAQLAERVAPPALHAEPQRSSDARMT